MSKKYKNAQKEKRKQDKRGRKAANKARYAELKRTGQNSKSKRFSKNNKKNRKARTRHATGVCHNIACKRCFPHLNLIPVEKVVQLTGKQKYQRRVGQKISLAA